MNPYPDPTAFLPMTRSMRARIEATIEQLVALLDEIDGDPDLEPANDDEPSLGWPDGTPGRGAQPLRLTGDDDRELEDENDEEGGDAEPWLGWCERWSADQSRPQVHNLNGCLDGEGDE